MILCFSGTGNSRFVARYLSTALRQNVVMIGRELFDRPEIDSGDGMIVWVCPVYSWGMPPVVRKMIALLQPVGPTRVHHLVFTCGDDVGRAPEMFRRDISARGWTPGGIWSVTMPNNYVIMKGFDVDNPDVAAAKLAAMPRRVECIAREIATGALGTTDVVRGRFAWVKTHVIYPWFIRHAMSPAPFSTVKGACIGCGKCVVTCPMKNVRLVSRRPVWGDDCAFCLACYHVCPRHAVAYGTKTSGKGRYMAPR